MIEASRTAHIAHVLFLDVVGHSKQTTSAQARTLERLTTAVKTSPAYAEAEATGALLPLPTGDGMALLFLEDVTGPARCARDIAVALRAAEPIPVRMGAHSGLVQRQVDVAGRDNVVGEGINTANRIMGFGDAGHILLSAQYALWLRQFDEWLPFVHEVGEGTAKHGVRLQLYSLHGVDFGNSAPPTGLAARSLAGVSVGHALRAGASGPAALPATSVTPQKVVLLYKRHALPDEEVIQAMEARLRDVGHEVFVDHHVKIGLEWARAIDERIRRADAVIAIVSPEAMRSEMLEYELEAAHDQHAKTGKPAILPVKIGAEEVVDGAICEIIRPLNYYLWSGPEDDQRLLAELLSAIEEPLKPRSEEVRLEPVGGAVPPDSPFYVARESDAELMRALDNGESILLVKGPRQIGKTSMLAQAARRAREHGWRVGTTDFQKLSGAQMASEEIFYKLLAATLARQLKFQYDFNAEWMDLFGANLNMENFLRELLGAADERLVWLIDEVDKLFGAPYASEFFGLVRSWHNSRSTEPGGPWNKLTVVIAYATEAHLFIQDLNQSPFNVGRRLHLDDFNLQQLLDLNGRYGGPIRSYTDAETLYTLIGGQPFLTRAALDALATGKTDFASMLEQATREDGPFSDHLKRLLVAVSILPNVAEYVRGLLAGAAKPDADAYHRLLAAGVVRQLPDGGVDFRCALYRQYLARHLG